MIECNIDTCKARYIGESERNFSTRILEHIGYIRNKDLSKSTGYHFNLPGHSVANMKAIILEKVKKRDENYRKEREHFMIRKFNTYLNGLNKEP